MRTSRLLALNPGDGKARELKLGRGEITVGGDDGNDLTVIGAGVSRRHALIRATGRRYELRDLGSTNGSFVNGKRIAKPTVLIDGDETWFGSARFAFLDPKARAAEVRPAATRSPRKLIALRTKIELLAAFFVIGFMIAEYVINRDYLKGLVWQQAGSSGSGLKTPLATVTEPSQIARPANALEKPMHGSTGSRSQKPPSVSTAPVPELLRPRRHSPLSALSLAGQPHWLARVNYYRAMVRLPPVSEDAAFSDGDFKHARYLVKEAMNGRWKLVEGGAAHNEAPDSQWYSAAGLSAGKRSDVIPPCPGCVSIGEQGAIDMWMSGPFHRLSILDSRMVQMGFGQFSDAGLSASALHTLTDVDGRTHLPVIAFPPDGVSISLRSLDDEWPSP